ncbi:cache domain-containing sensor histidine kinase [Paenibacillus periandrae]|uniref:cache domain-containing sensor histidine kinase n=1 Tax=Paenibacillus periandrae TaxID=1761741 RepID=UPI001F09E954|nr:sensor histidine kinase [Paenibacillus periandrae]
MKAYRLNRIVQKISLRQKLILTSLVCLVVPACIMLYLTSYSSKNIIKEQTYTNSLESLKIIQNNMNNLMTTMITVSNSIQFDSDIKTTLMTTTKDNMSVKMGRMISGKLEQLTADKSGMYITLAVPDGRFFTNYSFDDFTPSLFLEQPWFKQLYSLSAFETKFIGLQPNYLKSRDGSGKYVITIARTLLNAAAEPYAILIVSYNESNFNSLFGGVINTQSLYLLDDNKTIISQINPALLGKNFNLVTGISNRTSSDTIRIHDQEQLFVTIPLRYSDWEIASIIPYKQATDKLNAIYQSNLWLQIVFFVFFVMILLVFIRQFTEPIVKLGRIAGKVEIGIMDVRSGITGYDEVGRLGRSFDHMLDRIKEMIRQIQVEQELKRQTEFELLKAQINPHFLFNILNSIRMHLIVKKDEESAGIVGSLTLLLRATISNNGEMVPLHSEIAMVRQYMDLMNFTIRVPAEAVFDMEDSEVLLELVPRFILQPLIENAYKHGLPQVGGRISVFAEKMNRMLLISIRDNGSGMSAEVLAGLQERFMLGKMQLVDGPKKASTKGLTGVGLSNVYDRLKMIYGDPFKMQILSKPGQGTTVSLYIPISLEDPNYA